MKVSGVLLCLTLVIARSSADKDKCPHPGPLDTVLEPMPDPEAKLKVLDLSSSDNDSPWVSEEQGVKTWKFQISAIECQSARVHLSSVQLQGDDRLLVYGLIEGMRVGEEIVKGQGNKDGKVYTHRLWADELVLQLFSSSAQSTFVIRYVQYGDCVRVETPQPVGGVCGAGSAWEDAVCYNKEYPEAYRLASGIVYLRFLLNGTTGPVSLCTGFKTSDDGIFMTAYHCLPTQAVVDTAEILDHYESPKCHENTGVPRKIMHGDKLIWTSGSIIIDASIFTVKENDYADQIPCVPLSCNDPGAGTRINMIQHPNGLRKKINIRSNNDTGGFCIISSLCRVRDFCYNCDTLAGSSAGAPMFDFNTGEVIALHHRGGCPLCPNSGVRMSLVLKAAENRQGTCSSDPVIDAAVYHIHNKRTYFFRNDQYWRWNDTGNCPDEGYPKRIGKNWKGIPDDLDTAFVWSGNQRLYFFKGSQYWRWSERLNRVDDGYPKPISAGWKGLPDSIGTANKFFNGRTYFFKESLYWRWNDTADAPDDGYPRPFHFPKWPGLPTHLDASVTLPDGQVFYFKQKQYYKFTFTPGDEYPRATCWGWKGLPCY